MFALVATALARVDTLTGVENRLPRLTGKTVITYEQLNKALQGTDCNAFVEDKHISAPANDTCWHYKRPKTCAKGYIKTHKMEMKNAKVGQAAVNVANGNEVSLVVGDVQMETGKTKFTVQDGLFPCDGTITAVIKGAAAAVTGALKVLDGIPTIADLVAHPLEGVVVEIEHVLDGVCGFIEAIIGGLLQMLIADLEGLINTLIPQVVQELLVDLVGKALGGNDALALLE